MKRRDASSALRFAGTLNSFGVWIYDFLPQSSIRNPQSSIRNPQSPSLSRADDAVETGLMVAGVLVGELQCAVGEGGGVQPHPGTGTQVGGGFDGDRDVCVAGNGQLAAIGTWGRATKGGIPEIGAASAQPASPAGGAGQEVDGARATAKGIITGLRHVTGEVDIVQAAAICKGLFTDISDNGAAESHAGQAFTSVKRIFADMGDILANRDIYNVWTRVKSTCANVGDTVRDSNSSETSTVLKGIFFNIDDTGSDIDAREVLAFNKGLTSNDLNAIGDGVGVASARRIFEKGSAAFVEQNTALTT